MRDRADQGRLDVDACRAYLTEHAASFVSEFDDAVARARAEDE
jgi:hypothetical protein